MIFVIAVMITVLSLIGCFCIKNSVARMVLCVMAGLGLILAVLIGCFTYTTKYRINHVDSSTSPDGQYEVMLKQIGDPEWPFGATHARLILNGESQKISQSDFVVLNDGGCLTQEDWSVTWEETCVKIIISGEEQPDKLFTLYFDGKTESQQLDLYDMPISLSENNEASAELKQMAEIYKDYDQDSISEIQMRISELGYPVSIPGIYTDMSNYQTFEEYLEKCEQGTSCSVTLYGIHEDGGVSRNKYIFDGSNMYLMTHNAGWNDKELQIYYSNYSFGEESGVGTYLNSWNKDFSMMLKQRNTRFMIEMD